jgi:ABC-type transport system involved in cytochrome bd biosynthesis fused ATPase/permease subunit
VLLIAHPPELVAHADRVVELEGGSAVRERAA